VEQVPAQLLGELNPALQFEKISLGEPVTLGQSRMTKAFDRGKKGIEIDVHQRGFPQMKISLRCRFHSKQAGLTQHLEQRTLPFALVGSRFALKLGQNLDGEVTDLNDADKTAEVEAVVAYLEKIAAVPIVVTNQRGKLPGVKARITHIERAMLKYLDALRHK
jgi:hypothetical protein